MTKRKKDTTQNEEKHSTGSGMQYPENYHISNKQLKLFAANASNTAEKREYTQYIKRRHHR